MNSEAEKWRSRRGLSWGIASGTATQPKSSWLWFTRRFILSLRDAVRGSLVRHELQLLRCIDKGKIFCQPLRFPFKNVTRHSCTHSDFHFNQQPANCIFICLNTGQALFLEIGMYIVLQTQVQGKEIFVEHKVLEVKFYKETNGVGEQDSQGRNLISNFLEQSQHVAGD